MPRAFCEKRSWQRRKMEENGPGASENKKHSKTVERRVFIKNFVRRRNRIDRLTNEKVVMLMRIFTLRTIFFASFKHF